MANKKIHPGNVGSALSRMYASSRLRTLVQRALDNKGTGFIANLATGDVELPEAYFWVGVLEALELTQDDLRNTCMEVLRGR